MPTRFAPKRSLNMPAGTRKIDPLRSGTATMRPFWTGVRPTLSAMKMPSAPSITQSMKLRSKCRKHAISVGKCPVFLTDDIRLSLSLTRSPGRVGYLFGSPVGSHVSTLDVRAALARPLTLTLSP